MRKHEKREIKMTKKLLVESEVVTVATICNDPSVQAQLLLIGGGVVHALLRSVTDKPVSLL